MNKEIAMQRSNCGRRTDTGASASTKSSGVGGTKIGEEEGAGDGAGCAVDETSIEDDSGGVALGTTASRGSPTRPTTIFTSESFAADAADDCADDGARVDAFNFTVAGASTSSGLTQDIALRHGRARKGRSRGRASPQPPAAKPPPRLSRPPAPGLSRLKRRRPGGLSAVSGRLPLPRPSHHPLSGVLCDPHCVRGRLPSRVLRITTLQHADSSF